MRKIEIGETYMIVLPGDVKRYGRVLRIDDQDQEVLVRWVGYRLPNEWVSIRDF